jgi:hypothetical protein
MIDPSPSVLTLKADLTQAIQAERRRRRLRRRALRMATIAVIGVLAASATAIGAGEALGVIQLGDGAAARRVSHVPRLGAFVAFCRSECGAGTTRFVYRVTPDEVRRDYNVAPGEVIRATSGVGCLPGRPAYAPQEIYVGSRHRLTSVDLESITEVARGRPGARLPRGAWVMLQPCSLRHLHAGHKPLR